MTFNEWWLSLPVGRQKVLMEDKWMLADTAFQAGLEMAKPIAEIKFVDYPSHGVTNYWTVCNTGATVILQTKEEAEQWAVNAGMRIIK
jgi:hypothetical protein